MLARRNVVAPDTPCRPTTLQANHTSCYAPLHVSLHCNINAHWWYQLVWQINFICRLEVLVCQIPMQVLSVTPVFCTYSIVPQAAPEFDCLLAWQAYHYCAWSWHVYALSYYACDRTSSAQSYCIKDSVVVPVASSQHRFVSMVCGCMANLGELKHAFTFPKRQHLLYMHIGPPTLLASCLVQLHSKQCHPLSCSHACQCIRENLGREWK